MSNRSILTGIVKVLSENSILILFVCFVIVLYLFFINTSSLPFVFISLLILNQTVTRLKWPIQFKEVTLTVLNHKLVIGLATDQLFS